LANAQSTQEIGNITPFVRTETVDIERNAGLVPTGYLPPSTTEAAIGSVWQDQMLYGSFPGFTDLQVWQEVIDSIGADF
jgi:hypothetical protein